LFHERSSKVRLERLWIKDGNFPENSLLLRRKERRYGIEEHTGSSPTKELFDKSKSLRYCNSQNFSGIGPVILLEDRISTLIFGAPKCKCPDKKFMETSNISRPLGSNGIWPLRWLELRNNASKLVKFCSPGDIDPLMLLLDRLRIPKLVRCPITCGIIPVILLSFKLRQNNLLEEHCGNFSMNSVMFPDDRLPSSHR
jgi:hypothetical protein